LAAKVLLSSSLDVFAPQAIYWQCALTKRMEQTRRLHQSSTAIDRGPWPSMEVQPIEMDELVPAPLSSSSLGVYLSSEIESEPFRHRTTETSGLSCDEDSARGAKLPRCPAGSRPAAEVA
jgi:hypothetical protein